MLRVMTRCWEGKIKRGALIHCGLRPNPPTMATNDALDDGETHPASGNLRGIVHALESAKELAGISHVEARSVVSHEIDRVRPFHFGTDFDQCLGAVAGKLYGIGKEINQNLPEQCRVSHAIRQFSETNFHFT